MTQQLLSPKQVIEDIRTRKYGIKEDGRQREDLLEISSDLRSAIEQLSTGLYGEDVHFILELIQNAEDNRYADGVTPDLKFVLLDQDPTHTPGSNGCLCVFNNERGFAEENVRSICATGKSTKTKTQGYIGEKGIGFKSVFIASGEPHIISNGYQFKFKGEGLDPNIELAFVVPYWLDSVPSIADVSSYSTVLLLPIKSDQRDSIESKLGRISPESILFLSKLENLSVKLDGKQQSIELARDNSEFPLVDLLISQYNVDNPIQRYWLQNKAVIVPAGLEEPKREGIKERKVSIAFPLSGQPCSGTLYAYLPTEIESGLPFLVNADFMLAANRESIQTNRAWSRWLRDEIPAVVIDGLMEMAKHHDLKSKLCTFVPLVEKLKSQDEFIIPVCYEVIERLKDSEVVYSSSGDLVKPEMGRRVTQEERALFQSCIDQSNFTEFKLVDLFLDKYSDQLKAIGVRELGVADVKECLKDEEWLSNQSSSWFLDLYSYLQKTQRYKGTDFQGLSISKLEHGICKAGEVIPYICSAEGSELKAINELIGAGFPPVYFIDSVVSQIVIKDSALFQWCQEKLGWMRFSETGYLIHTLLPYLDENTECLKVEQLAMATKAIISVLDDLDEEGKGKVEDKLPLLLDNGNILRREDQGDMEVITPRCLDPDLGWQNVFVDESDCEHFYVLSDYYHDWVDLNKSASFYSLVSTTDHPPMINYEVSQYHHVPGCELYSNYIWDDFSEYSTGDISLSSMYPPSSLVTGDNFLKDSYRRSLIKWLEKDKETRFFGDARYGFSQKAEVDYYYYSYKDKKYISAVEFYLNNLQWINTSHGLKRPSEIFIKENAIYEMFGDSLPYLKDDMSSELYGYLGVKKEVTASNVVDYLNLLSGSDNADKNAIIKLYKYLMDFGDDFKESFDSNPLIYIPSDNRWYITSELIWDDASMVMGDMYGWLSPDYEKTNLREFFVNKLKIRSAVDDEAMANAWLNLQEQGDFNAAKVEAKLSKIVPKLLSLVKSGKELPEWWQGFKENVMLWSRDDEFLCEGELIYADNRYLTDLFADEVSIAWIPDAGYRVSFYAPLFDEIGVIAISQAVTHSLDEACHPEVSYKSKILTDYSKRLLAYLVHEEFDDEFTGMLEEGDFSSILQCVEGRVDNLTITYEIEDYYVEKSVSDRSGFIDLEQQLVVLNDSSDDEEVKDDVAEFIARAIWGTRYRAAEDRVKAILSITGEKHYRKIRDKKDWRMPRELMAEVDKLISHSGLVGASQEQEPEESSTSISGASIVSAGTGVRPAHPNNASNNGSTSPSPRSPNLTPNTRDSTRSAGSGSRQGGSSGTRTSTSRIGGTNREFGEGNHAGGQGHTEGLAGGNGGNQQSRSRTRSITNKINRDPHRQRRVVSYVDSDGRGGDYSEEERNQNRENHQHRLAIGNAAEELVINYESDSGRTAKRMPFNNPGYDIESVCTDTGETRFIEVKGLDGEWGTKGVGISSTQYAESLRRGDDYWLYVVERALSDEPTVHQIKNPAKQITEYRFDSGWKDLSTEPVKRSSDNSYSSDKLSDYTDDAVCKVILDICLTSQFPMPEVGYELVDDDGEVVAEFELAWEEYQLAVSLEDIQEVSHTEGWAVLTNSEVKPVLDALEDAFNRGIEG